MQVFHSLLEQYLPLVPLPTVCFGYKDTESCEKQIMIENKYTPEKGCFEDKILSFI